MKNNFRDRREDIDMIIIHSMGEYIGNAFAYDFLEKLGLSVHFLVDAAGNIINGPNPNKVAFHAGRSYWDGQHDLNSVSIGIELLVPGNHDWATFEQAIKKPETFTEDHYKACAKICRDAMDTYPNITKDRILRHSEVSPKKIRRDFKIDPGEGFDMEKLKDMI